MTALCCLAGEPDVEAATSEPQEDCSCGLVEKQLAAGGLLLASASSLLPSASSSLLAGTSSSLLLASASSSLLAGTSGLLVEELLAAGSLLLASASISLLLTSVSSSSWRVRVASGLFLNGACLPTVC